MPKERFAEWFLSLVAPPAHAASIVGDLMENAGAHGKLWFWDCVARTAFSLLWHHFTKFPCQIICGAILGYYVYIALSLLLFIIGLFVAGFTWSIAYMLDNYTGLKLVTEWAGVRVPPSMPQWVLEWIATLTGSVVAPFMIGLFVVRRWPSRELAVWIALLFIWPVMETITRIPYLVLPAALTSLLLGLLWARWRSLQLIHISHLPQSSIFNL